MPSLTSFLSGQKDLLPTFETLITGVLIPIVSSLTGVYFNMLAFRCPCAPAENVEYGWKALFIPFAIILMVSFAIQLRSIAVANGSLCRDSKCPRLCLFPFTAFMKHGAFVVASLAWIVVAYFHGSVPICIEVMSLDWRYRFSVLAPSFSRMSEEERRGVLAKVPCANQDPLRGLVANGTSKEVQLVIVNFLHATAQDTAWLFLLAITVDILLMLSVQKLIFKNIAQDRDKCVQREEQPLREKTEELQPSPHLGKSMPGRPPRPRGAEETEMPRLQCSGNERQEQDEQGNQHMP
ncbi:uncharacterized protein LOC116937515 [Petromyzon marinus]|uniref:uncharacterized protein LOC116937515 n=1 Tax=Petromyzon marinus TaxID=7757 RepID=UPI003F6F6E49